MLTKCNCFNCSRHLEFNPQDAGQTITCPACGMDTKLYIPTSATPPEFLQSSVAGTSHVLETIRKDTCYPALRQLIRFINIAAMTLAGLGCLLVLLKIANLITAGPQVEMTWYRALGFSVPLGLALAVPYALACTRVRARSASEVFLLCLACLSPFVALIAQLILSFVKSIPPWLAAWYLFPLALLGGAFIMALAVFLIMAARDWLMLLIDIADCSVRTVAAAPAAQVRLEKLAGNVGL